MDNSPRRAAEAKPDSNRRRARDERPPSVDKRPRALLLCLEAVMLMMVVFPQIDRGGGGGKQKKKAIATSSFPGSLENTDEIIRHPTTLVARRPW